MVRTRYPAVTVITMGTNADASGRTVGARAASTEFVAFADDDSWWSAGSLRAAADLLAANPGVTAVAGRILVGPEQTPDPFCRVLARSPCLIRCRDIRHCWDLSPAPPWCAAIRYWASVDSTTSSVSRARRSGWPWISWGAGTR